MIFEDVEPAKLCEECRKGYPVEYKYCPFCSRKLERVWKTNDSVVAGDSYEE